MKYLICVAVIAVLAIGYTVITEKRSSKQADSGVDKKKLLDLVQKTIQDADFYTTVFATFYRWEKKGRYTTTYYYYYAVCFRENELIVIPVHPSGEGLRADDPMWVTSEQVKKIDVTKAGKTTSVEFFDAEKDRILALIVEHKTSNADKNECPLAINQQEEADKFNEFIEQFAKSINQ